MEHLRKFDSIALWVFQVSMLSSDEDRIA
jgi:hypothetical protein